MTHDTILNIVLGTFAHTNAPRSTEKEYRVITQGENKIMKFNSFFPDTREDKIFKQATVDDNPAGKLALILN